MKFISKKSASLLRIIIMVVLSFGFNCVTYYGTRLVADGFHHHDMTTNFDLATPLVPWTVLIYFGSFAFWVVNYFLGCFQDEKETSRLLCADLCAKIVCFILFLAVPTTNIRPEIADTGLMNKLMLLLYSIDPANNLFPSIHCLTSWFCVIAVRKQKDIPNWYKYVSVIIALAICVSTLTTKQHVVYDAIAGVGLAELSYFFVEKSGILVPYRKLVASIERRILSIANTKKPEPSIENNILTISNAKKQEESIEKISV